MKSFISFLSLMLLSCSLVFGATPQGEHCKEQTLLRKDHLDMTSPSAKIKLARAESILKTLVPDPQSYQLILSSTPSIGAEAVPPHVFSDKPTMIIYQGTLSPARSDQELAFVMAHELGHLNLHHCEKNGEIMEHLYTGPPAGISGVTFMVYHQKLQEQEADLFGLSIYEHAGYSLSFFPHTLSLLKINPNIHFGSCHIFRKQRSSLSMKDSHFSMLDRFQLLTTLVQLPQRA